MEGLQDVVHFGLSPFFFPLHGGAIISLDELAFRWISWNQTLGEHEESIKNTCILKKTTTWSLGPSKKWEVTTEVTTEKSFFSPSEKKTKNTPQLESEPFHSPQKTKKSLFNKIRPT